jgi:hypothetical protein
MKGYDFSAFENVEITGIDHILNRRWYGTIAKAYCTMLGRRFFSTEYKEIKVDIYIF